MKALMSQELIDYLTKKGVYHMKDPDEISIWAFTATRVSHEIDFLRDRIEALEKLLQQQGENNETP